MKVFALVGKPNVGKSTLFNRLVRKRLAIVDETPGVTRDRNMAMIDYRGYQFLLVDTGGFEPDSREVIPLKMKEQSQLAVEEADGIIFVLDKSTGWTHQDRVIYEYLRKSKKPVYFTVNKIDHPSHEQAVAEFYESGADRIFSVSGEHGVGIDSLLEAMAEDFPEIAAETSDSNAEKDIISICFVGRPNAGKSSLVNCFIGSTKQIVDDTPGTTRDPVDNYCRFHQQQLRLIDTAGIKKKSRVSLNIDKYSMIAALKSIERSDVALLIIDATEGVVEQDARIAGHIIDRGKALILVINKWDLIEKDGKTMDKMTLEIRSKLRFLEYVPLLFVSAKSGQRVAGILEKVLTVYEQYSKRIQTSDLNEILQSITARHTPPVVGQKATKLYYATQVSIQPPTFMITSNHPEAINLSYRRYVVAQFRHFFGFEGTPIQIYWRDRSKRNPDRKNHR